jgi:hypothetical protein
MSEPEIDIPSQFSPRALLGDAERCLAFRCVVKRISHEENQQVRQKFNRHRSRLPALANDGRYASAGARERFLQYLAVNHRADLEKAGFTGKQIGQMADLRPFDPRADNVIWQVHHKIPIQVSGLLKDPNDFKNLVFLPEHEHRAILHSQYLDRQLAGLEPGNRRSVTIFQPVGCISVTTGKKFAQQLEHSEDRLIDFSAVQHEQVLVQRPQGTQQSLDESVGKLRKGRPPNQLRVPYAMPMSLPGRGRAPSL